MKSLEELRSYADTQLFRGEFARALHAYATLVECQPSDLDARMRIGDTLLSLGEVQRAAEVYTGFARHAALSGYPLRALVALKVLEALEPQLGKLLSGIAELYSVDSNRLGRSVRSSLANLHLPIPDGWSPEPPGAEELITRAVRVATHVEGRVYPDRFPPVPLFSELPADAFAAVLGALKLRRTKPGETIITQGEPGTAFYVVARGKVAVTRTTPAGEHQELATLHDGAIFGEMALVSAQPRTATVTAARDTDLLEFDREALIAASKAAETIARALDKFTRERLLSNLLATAPLFRPLDRTQRFALVRRFSAHDVAAGTDLIREGQPGKGLFAVLNGDVEVWKQDEDKRVSLATLHAGDVFGEIALMTDEPTTATVTARTSCSVLFLAREYFQRLVGAVPEIREYVEELGEERLMDTRLSLVESSADMGEGADEEGTLELAEDDLIMI